MVAGTQEIRGIRPDIEPDSPLGKLAAAEQSLRARAADDLALQDEVAALAAEEAEHARKDVWELEWKGKLFTSRVLKAIAQGVHERAVMQAYAEPVHITGTFSRIVNRFDQNTDPLTIDEDIFVTPTVRGTSAELRFERDGATFYAMEDWVEVSPAGEQELREVTSYGARSREG